jgi:uncharacterized protein
MYLNLLNCMRSVLTLAVMITGCSQLNPMEDGVPLGGLMPGGSAVFPHMRTYRERAFENVVRQRTDFSCGAAALGTVLKYAYGMNLDESEMIERLYTVSDPALARQRGFSLLDMKKYLTTIGMQGVGYRINYESLYQVRVPVIVLLNMGGYEHFLVVRKATPDGIYVADPALGNRTLPTDLFRNDWQFQVIFAVIGKGYIPDNVLVSLEKPLSTKQQVRSLMPAFNPVGEEILSSTAASVLPGLLVSGFSN